MEACPHTEAVSLPPPALPPFLFLAFILFYFICNSLPQTSLSGHFRLFWPISDLPDLIVQIHSHVFSSSFQHMHRRPLHSLTLCLCLPPSFPLSSAHFPTPACGTTSLKTLFSNTPSAKSPFTLRITQTLTIGCCLFHPRSLLVLPRH